MACTIAGIQIIVVLLAFTVFSFLPNRNVPLSTFWQRILLLLVVSWQTSCRLLHAFHASLDRVLFSFLKHSVEDVLTVALSVCAVGLLIARSINNITGPTNARIQLGYKVCTSARQGEAGWL